MANWVKVETRFPSHPKVLDIGPLGEALWLRGLCYAGEQLTDGFIPSTFVKRMGDMKAVSIADRLVNAGLWEEVPDGYQIHDFLSWQRSREQVDDISSKRAESGRRGGKQKASNLLANGKQVDSESASKHLPDTDTDTDTDTEQNRERDERVTAPSIKPDSKPRAHRLPKDWTPDQDAIQWAVNSTGLSPADIEAETEKFRDHFSGNGKTMTDWLATWRNWIRRSLDFRPTGPIPIRTPTKPQLPPVMQPGHVPKDGGLAEWRNAGTSGG